MKWQRPRAGGPIPDSEPEILADDGRHVDAYTSGPSDAAPVLPAGRNRAVSVRAIVMVAVAVAGVLFLAGQKVTADLTPPRSPLLLAAQATSSLAPEPTAPVLAAVLPSAQPSLPPAAITATQALRIAEDVVVGPNRSATLTGLGLARFGDLMPGSSLLPADRWVWSIVLDWSRPAPPIVAMKVSWGPAATDPAASDLVVVDAMTGASVLLRFPSPDGAGAGP